MPSYGMTGNMAPTAGMGMGSGWESLGEMGPLTHNGMLNSMNLMKEYQKFQASQALMNDEIEARAAALRNSVMGNTQDTLSRVRPLQAEWLNATGNGIPAQSQAQPIVPNNVGAVQAPIQYTGIPMQQIAQQYTGIPMRDVAPYQNTNVLQFDANGNPIMPSIMGAM